MRDRLKFFSGPGLFSTPISTSNLHTPKKEEVLRYLEGNMDRPEERLFPELERRLREYHQTEHCVLFSTGFWALVAAIKLRALPGKSQVIIPSLTYRRLADVVFWSGLVPVFVDVEAEDLAISPRAIAESVSDETALILAVHPIVNCCNVTAILAIGESRGVPVIIDAVESAHETTGGRRVGSFGVGEVFSLHASKLVNGLEGGYVCTNDPDFAAALERYKTGSTVIFSGRAHRGLNALPFAGHAAFALAGLDELPPNIAHNRSIYFCYRNRLPAVTGVRLLIFDEHQQTSYKNIVVEVQENFPVSRDVLVTLLNTESILARKYYCPPLHRKSYRYPVVVRDMTQTERAEGRYLNLPCGSRVAERDVQVVCDFLEFVGKNSAMFQQP